MVAFLEKPVESDGFAEIIDFLKASFVHYALTVNPIIYTSCIEQFWATAKVQTVNGVRQLQALVDKKRVIITESRIRSDLQLEDAGGTDCLPTTTIFEELVRMGYEKPSQKLTFYKAFFSPQWKYFIHTITQCLSAKSTAWNEFSSTMASLIICLATNQKFNLSKYIFDAMVKYLDGGVKFLMYPQEGLEAGKEEEVKNYKIEKTKESWKDDDLMFKTGVLDDDEVFVDVTTVEKEEQSTKTGEAVTTAGVEDSAAPTCEVVTTAGVEDSVAPTIPTTVEEALAQTLMEIKAAKPKAKGIIFHDQEEQVSVSKLTVSVTQPSVKDKGKCIIQEPERPLIRKEQVALDKQMARDIQAQLDAKLIEEERLERQKHEEANIALIES
ncbi:hypothetical protein Tco_0559857 [Tanacetum coccineum]